MFQSFTNVPVDDSMTSIKLTERKITLMTIQLQATCNCVLKSHEVKICDMEITIQKCNEIH